MGMEPQAFHYNPFPPNPTRCFPHFSSLTKRSHVRPRSQLIQHSSPPAEAVGVSGFVVEPYWPVVSHLCTCTRPSLRAFLGAFAPGFLGLEFGVGVGIGVVRMSMFPHVWRTRLRVRVRVGMQGGIGPAGAYLPRYALIASTMPMMARGVISVLLCLHHRPQTVLRIHFLAILHLFCLFVAAPPIPPPFSAILTTNKRGSPSPAPFQIRQRRDGCTAADVL